MKLRLFGKGHEDDGDEPDEVDAPIADAADADADADGKAKPGGAAARLFDQDGEADDEPSDETDEAEDLEDTGDLDDTGDLEDADEPVVAATERSEDDVDDELEDDGEDGIDDEEDGDADVEEQEDEEADDEVPERVAFELETWGARERKLLDNELRGSGVRWAWEAGTLVVAGPDAQDVEDLITMIQDRLDLDLSPDVEPVIYDIGDWPPGLEDRFVEVLIDERIAHARGYREITVGIDDEEKVDELVEKVSRDWETEQPTEDELDGSDAQEVLSDLFLSADRLTHSPKSKSDSKAFEDAAAAAADLPLPFGFEQSDWDALLADVAALGELLADGESFEDDIMDAAANLRSRLRPLV